MNFIAKALFIFLPLLIITSCGGGSSSRTALPPTTVTPTPPPTNEPGENNPSPINFSARTSVELDTDIISETVTLSGFTGQLTLTIEGATFSLDGSNFTSEPTQASSGQNLQIKVRSADTPGTLRTARLRLGNMETRFDVTTLNANQASVSLLDRLEQSCINAGAQWENKRCKCPTQDNQLQLFSAAEGGRCESVNIVMPSCLNGAENYSELYQSEGIDAFELCFNDLASNGLSSTLITGEVPEQELAAFATWLDDNALTGKVHQLLPAGTRLNDKGFQQRVNLQWSYPDESISYRRAPYTGFTPGPDIEFGSSWRTLYVSRASELSKLTGVSSPDQPTAIPIDLVPLTRAHEFNAFANATEYDEIANIRDCLGVCTVTATATLAINGNGVPTHKIRHQRRYQGGKVYDERLYLFDSSSTQLIGWVQYDFNGEPNLLVVVDTDTQDLEIRIRPYSYNFEPLGEFTVDLSAEVDIELSFSLPFAPGETAVIMCDPYYTGAMRPAMTQQLLLGPNRGQLADNNKSYFGWLQASTDDIETYYDGVFFGGAGLGLYQEDYLGRFSYAITHIVLGHESDALNKNDAGYVPGIRFIPFSNCLARISAIPSILDTANTLQAESSVRIANMAVNQNWDYSTCKQRFPEGLPEQLLWISAAGNGRRNISGEQEAYNCPGALKNRNNLIVVGSAGADRGLVNFGSRYTDIGADSSIDGGIFGSEISASRVSHIAANIILRYQNNLSNSMLRAAILLSALLPEEGPLPNRTGGVAKLHLALDMAEVIIDRGLGLNTALTEQEVENILTEFYVDEEYSGDNLARFKLQRLKNNGFFE